MLRKSLRNIGEVLSETLARDPELAGLKAGKTYRGGDIPNVEMSEGFITAPGRSISTSRSVPDPWDSTFVQSDEFLYPGQSVVSSPLPARPSPALTNSSRSTFTQSPEMAGGRNKAYDDLLNMDLTDEDLSAIIAGGRGWEQSNSPTTLNWARFSEQHGKPTDVQLGDFVARRDYMRRINAIPATAPNVAPEAPDVHDVDAFTPYVDANLARASMGLPTGKQNEVLAAIGGKGMASTPPTPSPSGTTPPRETKRPSRKRFEGGDEVDDKFIGGGTRTNTPDADVPNVGDRFFQSDFYQDAKGLMPKTVSGALVRGGLLLGGHHLLTDTIPYERQQLREEREYQQQIDRAKAYGEVADYHNQAEHERLLEMLNAERQRQMMMNSIMAGTEGRQRQFAMDSALITNAYR